MMRLNREGLPICKDLHGLYTTMLISLCDRWPDWRYSLAFVLPAVVQRMQALQFVQIVRDSAGGLHNMLSLSQVKTSFIMSTDTAWRICQAFLDAGLLERAQRTDGDVYAPTPKGLHLVDRFVTRHGIATRSVSNLLNMHPVCDKLLFLERDDQDDVLLSDNVVRIVFHRLVGLTPRREEPSALGLALETTQARDATGQAYETACFASIDALLWLVNYTTLVSLDEAAILCAHMIRLGWIEAELGVPPEHSSRVATVRVDDELRMDGAAGEGTFVEGEVYHITERGASVAWHVDWDEAVLSNNAPPRPPTSMSDAQKAHEMHAVSPRLDAFELYGAYANQPGAVSPATSPIQGMSPYMGMSPLPHTSPLPRPSPLPRSTALPKEKTAPSSTLRPDAATGLGLKLGGDAPGAAQTHDAPQGTSTVRAAPAMPEAAATPAPAVPAAAAPPPAATAAHTPAAAPAAATHTPVAAPAAAARAEDPGSLAYILHDPKLRRAFSAFLSTGNAALPLQFWCEIEWFRNDCRVASSGQTPQEPADAVAELPSRAPEARASVDGPKERAALRPVLETRARTRIAPFLTPEAVAELRIGELDALTKVLQAYTEPTHRALPGTTEAARESEVQLAQLLVQCAAAQKLVYNRLADVPRKQFLAARGEL